MLGELRSLWRGDVPLERAFWTYAVAVGLAVNLTTSLLFLFFISAGWTLSALAVGYGPSLPYNVVATVGVWRAAGRHGGDTSRAELFRMVTLIGMLLLTVT